jgi:hypothetical protein
LCVARNLLFLPCSEIRWGWKTNRNGTKRNGKNGTLPETKRNETERNGKNLENQETKRKAAGNQTKRNDII